MLGSGNECKRQQQTDREREERRAHVWKPKEIFMSAISIVLGAHDIFMATK
jgi:hypothetical protein